MTEIEQPCVEDLQLVLKGRGRQTCERQTKVFLALWGLRQSDPLLENFNQAELARELGMSRQAICQAMRSLRQKGLVVYGKRRVLVVREVVKERRTIDLMVPLPDQMSLPFPGPARAEAMAHA